MSCKRLLMVLALGAALAGCGREQPGRGGLSAEEERRLDNAAKMLDEQMENLDFSAPEGDEGNAAAATPGNAATGNAAFGNAIGNRAGGR